MKSLFSRNSHLGDGKTKQIHCLGTRKIGWDGDGGVQIDAAVRQAAAMGI